MEVEISTNEEEANAIPKEEKLDTVSNSNTENSENNADPFAYVNNDAFTSEKFKIEIRGLPKFYGIKELRTFLNSKLKLNCNKVKFPNSCRQRKYAYACFRSEEDRNKAIDVLKGIEWKKSKLSAKISQPVPDPLIKRRNNKTNITELNIDTEEKEKIAIQDSASPLWSKSYEEQIRIKTEAAKGVINRLNIELSKNSYLADWVKEQKLKNNGMICKLMETRFLKDHSEKYRNKCEFTIGRNDLSGKTTVGFRLGSYADGSLSVVSVDGIKTIPDTMAKAAKLFENFVQDSKYEPYSPETLKGNWKVLTVRVTFNTNQVMLIVGFDPQDLPLDELNALKNDIKTYFNSLSEFKVDSLYFKLMPRSSKGQNQATNPPELLLGEPIIEEILCGLKFKISPESFFQINTKCAEILIQCVKELANVNKETVVVDVCCGTGMLGLCLANDCKNVLGVEIVQQAINDAKENATKNQLNNCEFYCGKADEILTAVINKVQDSDIVAIIDPPRAGCHKKALNMIRKARNLNRLIFLSCDSKSALNNFVELARAPSKTLQGEPFVPIAAIPVDMFPQTNHFELVLYFERLESKK